MTQPQAGPREKITWWGNSDEMFNQRHGSPYISSLLRPTSLPVGAGIKVERRDALEFISLWPLNLFESRIKEQLGLWVFLLLKAIFVKKTCSAASTHTFGFDRLLQSVLNRIFLKKTMMFDHLLWRDLVLVFDHLLIINWGNLRGSQSNCNNN